MSTKELAIATSTVWVVIAAVLVMFMQAGFAFLEAGLTRMKNVGHIAARTCSSFPRVDRLLPRRLRDRVRRRRQRARWRIWLCSVDRRPADGRGCAFLVVHGDSRSGRILVPGRLLRRLLGDRLGRDGGANEALGLLCLRDCLHTHLLRCLPLDLESRRLAVREGDAGLRRLDGRPLPGRSSGSRRSAPTRPADRQVRPRRQAERNSWSQRGVRNARRDHPLVRLVRLQLRLDAQCRFRGSASSPTLHSTRISLRRRG